MTHVSSPEEWQAAVTSRERARVLVELPQFNLFIVLLIVINTSCMMLERYPMPAWQVWLCCDMSLHAICPLHVEI